MTRIQRILSFFSGLFMIAFGIIIALSPSNGYIGVLLVLEITLLVSGIRQMTYYFTMARNMVGGIYIFYKAVFLLDVGLFTLNMDDVPRQYAMIYLIATMAFAGLVDMLRAREIKRLQSGKWKYQIASGVGQLLAAAICLLFLNNPAILSFVYGAGIIHRGCVRIHSVFRKSAIVYIS